MPDLTVTLSNASKAGKEDALPQRSSIHPPVVSSKVSYSVSSYVAWLVDYLSAFISTTRRFQLSRYLQGNYAPVRKEFEAVLCKVEAGSLPADLSGDYTRIGPNPFFNPIAE